MATHSEGPWKVDPLYGEERIWIEGITNSGIAYIMPIADDDGEERLTEEDYANARLIAAAPDLLKALKHMVAQCDRNQRPGGGDDVPLWVRAAIAKAESK